MDDVELRFTALYEQYAFALHRYVLRRVSPEAAHDVVSDVFVTAWRRFDEVQRLANPLPWLYAVAKLTLANEHRASLRRDRLAERVAVHAGDGSTGDRAGEMAELLGVATAFDSLSEADREVLRLVAWEHLTAGDAATALGISRPAFSMRLNRARRRLERRLQEPGAPRPEAVQPKEQLEHQYSPRPPA